MTNCDRGRGIIFAFNWATLSFSHHLKRKYIFYDYIAVVSRARAFRRLICNNKIGDGERVCIL